MSKYDPDDGYEECLKCGELTREPSRMCGTCSGVIVPKKQKVRGARRKPSYYNPGNPTRRKHNHSFD